MRTPTYEEFKEREHGGILCAVCGERKQVFMKRMDWKDHTDLYVLDDCDPDFPPFHRADGMMRCSCGKEYWRHPHSEHKSFDGLPYLRRLCDGTLVKL